MILFIIVVLAAVAFEYINGFHDAANAIATVVSTKVLTPRQAIALAAFFNLTGALIVRAAPRLLAALRPGGVLILSGILAAERDDIRHAFANQTFVDVVQQDEWLGFTLRSAR